MEVTVSVGGVSFPQTDARRVEDLLDAADRALYRSKNLGRDRFTLHHDPEASTAPA